MSERDLGATEVATRLGLDEGFTSWLVALEAAGPPSSPARLPDKQTVGDLFARLGMDASDAAEIIDAWPQPSQSPEMWWLLQRCHQQLVAQMCEPYSSPRLQWKQLPHHLGAFGKFFYIYVFLATLPAIRQWHYERGIPDDISWTTLADLGEHLTIHRRIFGSSGLDVPSWLTLHFGGKLFRLGRLQFERWRISQRWQIDSDEHVDSALLPQPMLGALALSVHIPESGGPLNPSACSDSFEQARSFFARHFPEETYHFARCSSWLLDPQLADYLPATSNIVRFQRLFHLVTGAVNDDESVMRFVFRRVAPSLDELPQRTTLERAVVSHLQAGGHWQVRSGWLAL